jgi:hypothetical protein
MQAVFASRAQADVASGVRGVAEQPHGSNSPTAYG